MTEDTRRVLLVGLQEGLLWQITRSLAQTEPRIEYQCAMDFSLARELSEHTFFHYIVVDGWILAWEAGDAVGWEERVSMKPWTWVVLVESLPLEGLLDERIRSNAVFLEKPFNPKDFPAFLRSLETGGSRRPCAEDVEDMEGPEHPPLPLEPGETYRPLEPDRGRTPAGKGEELPPSVKDTGDGFHSFLEEGFTSLRHGDLEAARASWQKALALRPDDKRVRANLARLEKVRKPPFKRR